MSTGSPPPAAEDAAPTRSSRTRVKSQRALESEQTRKLLARAKQQTRDVSSNDAVPEQPKKAARVSTKSRVKNIQELYCICKSDGEEGRPMIECETCKDWYHFDCIDLSENDAEKIHKYVCRDCEASTGETTTYIYDIKNFPSPPTPPDVERKRGTKRKSLTAKNTKRPKVDAVNSEVEVEDDDQEDDGDDAGSALEAESSSSSASSSASIRSPSAPNVRRAATNRERKAKPKGKGGKAAELPPARVHVQKKFVEVVQGLFEGGLESDEAREYAREMEESLWQTFKDIVGGKEVVAGRYKNQFNLLTSSLTKTLRPDLRSQILSRGLSASQVANLTPIDLASAERLEEMERARQAVLEQHVKATTGAAAEAEQVRFVRDGFERVEDSREKELERLAKAEASERRRESMRDEEVPAEERVARSPMVDTDGKIPPATPRAPSMSATPRPESVAPAPMSVSPTKKTFALRSAWGGGGAAKGETDEPEDMGDIGVGGDQMELDLSDLIGDEGVEDTTPISPVEEVLPVVESEMDKFEKLPVVWSGQFVNPSEASTLPVAIQIRPVSDNPQRPPPPDFWKRLLPHDPIAITGRVPSASSKSFLYESRMQPSKVLLCVALSVDPTSAEEGKKQWNGMAEFLISRDRHGVYLPYDQSPPPGSAKELYLIPLRPSDPLPEVVDLIEDFALPRTERSDIIFLGVFVADRKTFSLPVPALAPSLPPTMPILPSQVQGLGLQSDKLKELMKNLNPAALQGVLGGAGSPIGGGGVTPSAVIGGHPSLPPMPIGGTSMSPNAYTGYNNTNASQYHPPPPPPPPPSSQQPYLPYPPSQPSYHPPGMPPQPYGAPQGYAGYSPEPRRGEYGERGYDERRGDWNRGAERDRERSPGRGGRGVRTRGGGGGGGRAGREGGNEDRRSDNGWGNRGRGSRGY